MTNEQEQEEIMQTMTRKYNEFNVMQIRLETKDFLQTIEQDLQGGEYITLQNEEGIKTKFIKHGRRMANPIGVQGIMQLLKLHINPHTVQGNFISRNGVSEAFETFMYKFQILLGNHVMENLYRYDIDLRDYELLVQGIRDSVERFLSRSIDNKERDSYGETIKHLESNKIQSKGAGLFAQ